MRVVALALVAGCYQSVQLAGTSDGGDGSTGDGGPAITSPRKLTIFDPQQSAAVGDLPVLVQLDSTNFDYSQVDNPPTKIRFVESGNPNDLPYEIERWDPAGVSRLWIQIKTLPPTGETVELFFGDGISSNPVGIVFNDYAFVMHMESLAPNPGGAFGPGVAQGTGKLDVGGEIDDCFTMSNTADGLILGSNSNQLFSGVNAFTLDFWMYADYATVASIGTNAIVVEQAGALQNITLENQTTARLFATFAINGTPGPTPFVDLPDLRTWHDVAFVYNGSTFTPFLDGNIQTVATAGASALATNGPANVLRIGTNTFHGRVDEVRVSNNVHVSAYMRAAYLASANRLVTFSDGP
jgi:hypothetical protein